MKPPIKITPGIHTLAPNVGQGGVIKIALAGGGGNGSQMITLLARMAYVMGRLGMARVDLDLYDPDRVSAANVGRGLFLEREEGQYKALALIHRANATFGLQWQAFPERYVAQRCRSGQTKAMLAEGAYDFLITCVDTGAARKTIFDALCGNVFAPHYWLDLANEADFGQVLLGEIGALMSRSTPRLPTIVEKYPAHYDGTIPESDAPSCSLEEALLKQSLFINDHVARWAATLLWELLEKKQIDKIGAFISLRDGKVNPVKVDAPVVPPTRSKAAGPARRTPIPVASLGAI